MPDFSDAKEEAPGIDAVRDGLNRLAGIIGRAVGTHIGVDGGDGGLFFTDDDGDVVAHDGVELIAATKAEIAEHRFLEDFHVRALRAACINKYQEIERSRS